MLNRLSIGSKRIIIILIIIALVIPILIFAIATFTSNNSQNSGSNNLPTKAPLPTFADVPRIEGELTIQYYEGQEFHNLSEQRQNEITSFLQENGVVSQEKSYESEEGPLSGYYLIKFKEGVNIEEAAEEIYEIPEIIGVQPNNQVELF